MTPVAVVLDVTLTAGIAEVRAIFDTNFFGVINVDQRIPPDGPTGTSTDDEGVAWKRRQGAASQGMKWVVAKVRNTRAPRPTPAEARSTE